MSILIIEDDFSLSDSLKELLLLEGYTSVVTVNTYPMALHELHSRSIDLVICDIQLSINNDTSGLDFLSSLKSDPKYNNVPVIVYTGLSSVEIQREAFKRGADDFLVKGGSTCYLLEAARVLITRAKLRTVQATHQYEYIQVLGARIKTLEAAIAFSNSSNMQIDAALLTYAQELGEILHEAGLPSSVSKRIVDLTSSLTIKIRRVQAEASLALGSQGRDLVE